VAVRIRLKRMGGKKKPFYRLVVADSRAARDGRFIEELGYYDPIADPVVINIDEEKAIGWLRKGARPSDTARRLLKQAGVLDREESNTESSGVVAAGDVTEGHETIADEQD